MFTTGPRKISIKHQVLFHNWNIDKNTNVLAQNQEENTSSGTNFQSRIASSHKQYFLV